MAQRWFPGGIFLMTPKISEVKEFVSELTERGEGKVILILAEGESTEGAPLDLDSLTETYPNLSLILVARDTKQLSGNFFAVNLDDADPASSPRIIELCDKTSSFGEPPFTGRILGN